MNTMDQEVWSARAQGKLDEVTELSVCYARRTMEIRVEKEECVELEGFIHSLVTHPVDRVTAMWCHVWKALTAVI